MKLSGNTILITGSTSGIGLAIAERFHAAGSQIILCGRRQEELRKIEARLAGAKGIVCDVGQPAERGKLAATVARDFPGLNVLINNAGIQNRLSNPLDPDHWKRHHEEIGINLEAPMHLTQLLLPHLKKQAKGAVMNVSSGLAFVPLAFMPTYCATKAALHSYTLSLRELLKGSSVDVVEIIPPAVDTDLGGKGLHTQGVPLKDFVDHTMQKIEAGELEFGYGFSEASRTGSREKLNELFVMMNAMVKPSLPGKAE